MIKNKKNIALVGYGYWGKIIHKNLINMSDFSNSNIYIYDPMLTGDQHMISTEEYQSMLSKKAFDLAFVAVPPTKHYDTCSELLKSGSHVFCEKPLCSNSWQASKLYELAENLGLIMFTDWIFTFNDQVNQIKKDYENSLFGNIKSIRMNRLNNGPPRFDVDARWDLASHDVSIIEYVFSPEEAKEISWKNYKQNYNSSQNDSTFGFLDYGNFKVFIDASWEYGEKDRTCIFEFEDKFVLWDDTRSFLKYYNNDVCRYVRIKNSETSPLINSIKSFISMSSHEMNKQKELTLKTLKTLEK